MSSPLHTTVGVGRVNGGLGRGDRGDSRRTCEGSEVGGDVDDGGPSGSLEMRVEVLGDDEGALVVARLWLEWHG